jgi:hypothetical protein
MGIESFLGSVVDPFWRGVREGMIGVPSRDL